MTGDRAPSIVVVGSTMMDMISYLPRLPAAGETLVGERFSLGFGGKGANQAVMARRLGAEVAMVNCLGTDVFGDLTLENFAREGIDVEHVIRAEGSSGIAAIWVEPDGTNRIGIVPGANDAMTPQQAETAVTTSAGVDVVLAQFEVPQPVTAAAFTAASARGVPTVLNPAPAADVLPELLAVTDWLVPNEVEFRHLAGAAGPAEDGGATDEDIRRVAQHLSVRLLVTLGEEGVAICGADGTVTRVGAPAVNAVDTTGAGDAFVGAFAYGLGAGMDEVAAARLGCGCAAASVTLAGTQTSFPAGAALEAARRWAADGPTPATGFPSPPLRSGR